MVLNKCGKFANNCTTNKYKLMRIIPVSDSLLVSLVSSYVHNSVIITNKL